MYSWLQEDGKLTETRSLDDLRKKAHEVNCDLAEENFNPREIEIIGYYLTRISASYLSYFTHKEIGDTVRDDENTISGSPPKIY